MPDAEGASSRLRSPAARTLIAAALTTGVAFGGAFLAMDRLHSSAGDTVEHPGPAATDAQTQAEVVEQAKSIVAIARLQQATAGYLLMSCKNRDDPPYQGAVYLNFTLPADARADQYFHTVAAEMVDRGWRAGPPPNEHLFGARLSKDGVNAILYQDNDSGNRGVARIYGQCRDVTNHRGGSTGWVDVTDRLQ
jgi:hypothetical protein